ncbi:TOBE domain-containing protein, partial [Nocardioides sp.]
VRSASCALGLLRLRAPVAAGPVRVAIRAEQVQVAPADESDRAGVVLDVSFYGHDATIRVVLDSGEHVSARTPANSVPRPGDPVRVDVVGEAVAFAV